MLQRVPKAGLSPAAENVPTQLAHSWAAPTVLQHPMVGVSLFAATTSLLCLSITYSQDTVSPFRVSVWGDSATAYSCDDPGRDNITNFDSLLQEALGDGYVSTSVWQPFCKQTIDHLNFLSDVDIVVVIGSNLCDVDNYSAHLKSIASLPKILSVYTVVPPGGPSLTDLEAVTDTLRNVDDSGHGELYIIPPVVDASDLDVSTTSSSCEGLSALTERIAASIAADLSEMSEDMARTRQKF